MSDEIKKSKNTHSGHKKRLREKFAIHNDFTGFFDHEILELLLNYGNVRKNTNTTAHALLDKFGSIDAVFDASRDELMTVDGIGENLATLILMQKALFGIYDRRKYDMKNRSIDSENLFTYVKSLFAGAKKEMLYMICVSKGGRITKTHLVTRGAGDFVSIDQREIVKTALNNDAWGIIFAHNHPTGIATPSNDDIETTKMLNRCLAFMNISLIEHYIVAGDKCVSIVNDKRYKLMK